MWDLIVSVPDHCLSFYFARHSLRSYFHEPQKNEIHLLYLHLVFTSLLFIICGIFI